MEIPRGRLQSLTRDASAAEDRGDGNGDAQDGGGGGGGGGADFVGSEVTVPDGGDSTPGGVVTLTGAGGG